MKRSAILLSGAVSLTLGDPAACLGVESIHYGIFPLADPSKAPMTDSIRLSNRISTAWWSQNQPRTNVENGTPTPYAYHDGYVEQVTTTWTPLQIADRWRKIITGQGDTYTGVSGASIGTPGIIILDELVASFTDGGQGTVLRQALQNFVTPVASGGQGGSREDIAAFLSPGFCQSTSIVLSNYDDVVYSANNYLRSIQLEYATETNYNSGGETYLASQLGAPLRKWTTTFGVAASRVQPTLLVSNFADATGGNYPAFLNQQFRFMSNGWYTAAHVVDNNVRTALRTGVSSYTWTAGAGDYQLLDTITTRDAYFEEFLHWYSVLGNTTLDNLWNVDAGGTFSTGSNWLTSAAPGGADSWAQFLFTITAPRTVTLSATATVGHVVFDNVNAYTLSGAGAMTLQVSSGSADVTVRKGSHTIASTFNLNSTTNFIVTPASSVLTLSGSVSYAAGVGFAKLGEGRLRVRNVRATDLSVSGGVLEIMPLGGSAGTSKVNTVSTPNPGKLDLQNNNLIVTTTPIGVWNGSNYTGVTGLIASGRNGGTWDGAGIVTSQADAISGYTSFGVARASDVLGIGSGSTAFWSGQVVTGSSTLVMYTYGGDANLSGSVDVDDYGQIDFNAGIDGILPGWYNGDFDYSGTVDVDDYGVIDFVVGIQGEPFLTSTAQLTSVPEPSAACGLTAFATLIQKRRRRR